jgi:dipeptidyl aminopeptidase/acylaminoacyl peptidase
MQSGLLPPSFELAYGPQAAQNVQCWEPAGTGQCRGVAVLVHGGYWRAAFDASLMEALVHDLTQNDWAVSNIEYRRGGNGGGWPTTGEDVKSAIAAVAATPWRQKHRGPMIGIGHSVGGQLALLAADRLDAVVALAPVTDVARTYRERLGEEAAAEFFQTSPDENPEVYASASPLRQLPLGVPTLVVHGATDQRVPVDHSVDFVASARAAGDQVDFESPHDLDHLAAIDPATRSWSSVRRWMAHTGSQLPRLRTSSSA